MIAPQVAEAAAEHRRTGKSEPAFPEFLHDTTTGNWSRAWRVVPKAEHLDGKENPRYTVTPLPPEKWPVRQLYEDLYCARGGMANRLKDQFTCLPAGQARRRCAKTLQDRRVSQRECVAGVAVDGVELPIPGLFQQVWANLRG